MPTKSKAMEKKTLNSPDETRTFEKGKVELASLGGITFGRANFEPGWRWSESVKPIVKTEYCEAPHVSYHVSGRLRIRMADGAEQELAPRDVGIVPHGHDTRVAAHERRVVAALSDIRE